MFFLVIHRAGFRVCHIIYTFLVVQAFCQLRTNLATNMYFFGIHETATESEFVQSMMLQDLAAKITTGEFSVPGHEKMQAEISDDLLEPTPPKPAMNKLVIATASDDASKLRMPVDLVKDSRPQIDSALMVGVPHAKVSGCDLSDPVLCCVVLLVCCLAVVQVWCGVV